MGLSDAIELAKIFGPQLVLLGFFVWWSFVREKAIAKRLNEVENARVEDLKTVVANNTRAVTELTTELRLRPCLRRRDQ